jgi:hypothetical protein
MGCDYEVYEGRAKRCKGADEERDIWAPWGGEDEAIGCLLTL